MQILYDAPTYLEKLRDIVDYKTVYGWGAFGAPADYDNNRQRYNVPSAPAGSFIFDCSGFAYKAIPWGWSGDPKLRYGGAIYKKIPELETNDIMTICSDVSTNFQNIVPGEVLYGKFNGNGHVGIYAGEGLVYECTTDFGGGCMVTSCDNVDIRGDMPGRQWLKHGKLPFIKYSGQDNNDNFEKMQALYDKICELESDAAELSMHLSELAEEVMNELERIAE